MRSVKASSPVVSTTPRLARFLPEACAVLLAVAVYINALDNPFVYDDFHLIVENASIVNPSDLQSVIVRDITRPLVAVSYALDTMLWGRRPLGYHVTNLLLHLINVWLVFCVVSLAVEDRRRQTGQRQWPDATPAVAGFAAAALLAVHPMLTQAVGYISGRSEVAYAVFFLLALLAGRRWMLRGGLAAWSGCVGLWVLAMLTKESAAMLPFVLVAYDWFVLDADRAERRRRVMRLVLPMIALMLVAGAWRVSLLLFVEYRGESGVDGRFALVAVDAFWRYLLMMFSPRGQSIFHAVPAIESMASPRVLAGLAGLGAYAGLVWVLRARHSLMALGLAWFALMLVPSSVLLILGRGEPLAEHRVYLSSVGLFLAWGCAFGVLWAGTTQRTLVALGAAALLAAFGVQTVLRNAVWEDPVRLAREAIGVAPDHWMPRILAGDALRQSGRCAEAVTEYRTAITRRAVEEYPYTMLARCLIQGRRLDEAEGVLHQLRAVHPASQEAAMGLGVFAIVKGQAAESRTYFEDVLARDPGRAQAKVMLAFVDGTLPAAERRGICDGLRAATGVEPPAAPCAAEPPQ